MPAICITGGISTGKTTFCDCLRELVPAAKIFNADQAARELVDLDPEVKKELAAEFGSGIFSSQISHFFMKPVVKHCATAWSWSLVLPASSCRACFGASESSEAPPKK